MKLKSLTVDVISLGFILLWMYAASSKLIDFEKFSIQLSKSPMLTQYSHFTAWLVPLVEILIAACLFIERFRLIGLYASYSLMVAFSAYIYAITHYSEVVPCSCGGILEDMTWQQHFIFNIILVLIGVIGILLYHPGVSKSEPSIYSTSKLLFE